MRVPVDSGCPGLSGPLRKLHDQPVANTFAAKRGRRKEILQVTGIFNRYRISMEDKVRQTNHLTFVLRNQAVNWFTGIRESVPCRLDHLFRESRLAYSPIEFVVLVPQWPPLIIVCKGSISNQNFVIHGLSLSHRKNVAASARDCQDDLNSDFSELSTNVRFHLHASF